jgi:hypothetical protein
MRGHADRNASLRTGQRLIARSQDPQKEKPHALLRRAKRESKDAGVGVSKACQTPKWAIYPAGKAWRSCQRAWRRPGDRETVNARSGRVMRMSRPERGRSPGKLHAGKPARAVWGGAMRKGPQGTSLVAYST